MLVAPYRTKKALREQIGQTFYYEETSFFGKEYHGNGRYTVVGPGAYERKWYATVTIVDDKIVSVK